MNENTNTDKSNADNEVNPNAKDKYSKLDIILALTVGLTTGALIAVAALDIAGCISDPK